MLEPRETLGPFVAGFENVASLENGASLGLLEPFETLEIAGLDHVAGCEVVEPVASLEPEETFGIFVMPRGREIFGGGLENVASLEMLESVPGSREMLAPRETLENMAVLNCLRSSL